MTPIPFVTLDTPTYGEVVQVSPLIRRVIAENPSKFTYHGTGTYIVGHGDVVVVDPGPRLDAHRDALWVALHGERVRAILVTHCHADHSPLAAWLAEATGAPTVAFGPHGQVEDPDDALDDALDDGEGADDTVDDGTEGAEGGAKVEESIDVDFDPDVRVADGEVAAEVPGAVLRAVHTPGHTSNHLCFELAQEQALFTGDHVMGWSTTVVAPPDGDMRAYIESLRRVRDRRDAVLWPTHGAPVTQPRTYVDALVTHRLEREAQVVAAVRDGLSSIPDIVGRLYADVRKELHKPAARSVLAHLAKLVDDGVIAVDGGVARLRATYRPS